MLAGRGVSIVNAHFRLSTVVSALIIMKLLLNCFNDFLSGGETHLLTRDVILAPNMLPLAEGFSLLLLHQLHFN